MRQKINRCLIICFWLLIIGLLIYSRFVNLGWGLPYPMHPDERNMATALQGLKCEFSIFNFQFLNKFQIPNLKECFNPHFFAYGQFPLYLGYFLIWISKGFRGFGKFIITFNEAAMSLRIISAIASVINVFVLMKIISIISKLKSQNSNLKTQILTIFLILIFSPYAIQFSHFGTTESLLMLFYSLIVYFSLKALDSPVKGTIARLRGNDIFFLSLFSGLAIATKVSAVIFMAVPLVAIINMSFRAKSTCLPAGREIFLRSLDLLRLLGMTVGGVIFFFVLFSPHNLINYQDFISAFRYESAVATGQIKVFYTREFEGTTPYLFQAIKVFPYTLGWPVYILSLLGFIFLSWKDKYLNLVRLAILIYFIPSGYIFAKWSRFMAPILPLMSVFAILFLLSVISSIARNLVPIKLGRKLRFARSLVVASFLLGMTAGAIIPGLSYLSVYQKPDVRFQASKWIYKNIPNNSIILSETANVVDIPISNETMEQSKNYNVISFDFYNLDESTSLQTELKNQLAIADYIFVPSRRIFANHPKDKYPLLNNYYEKLFSGKLGFKKVAEFSSGLNDEAAEETWTVFDHPVIRIYKRSLKNSKS